MDKKSLLESLRLNEEARGPDGGDNAPRWTVLVLIGLAMLVLGGAGGWFAARLFVAEAPAPRPEHAAGAAQEKVEPAAGPGAAVPSASQAQGESAQSPSATPAPVLTASGYVVARRMATVSAEITGRLVEMLVEEGDKVSQGQVVARLDDTLARTAVALARAQVEAARARASALEAQAAEARRELARKTKLHASGHVAEADVTRAQAELLRLEGELGGARANVSVAEQQVADARERLAKHVIRAPFAGVVINKAAQPGEIVSPVSAGGGFTRTGICTIVDMDSLEIEVDVAESYIARIIPGMRAQARLDAYPDWAIPAHVVAVIPTADRTKATVRVRVALDAKDERVLPDMGASVAFFAE